MKLFDAYQTALAEDSDPAEREELSASTELKTLMMDEVHIAMKKTRENIDKKLDVAELIKPLFGCMAFHLLIGIRVGKILRDAELAGE
jgi:hypothetical protein